MNANPANIAKPKSLRRASFWRVESMAFTPTVRKGFLHAQASTRHGNAAYATGARQKGKRRSRALPATYHSAN